MSEFSEHSEKEVDPKTQEKGQRNPGDYAIV